MSTQFFLKLSQNFIELLEDDEYYDITIEVGEDPYVKIFRAHMSILCYRSSYFREIIASKNKKNRNYNDLFHIKLQSISPEIFQIILKYIYGGIFSLNENITLQPTKISEVAELFQLQELVDHLQKHIIENKPEWTKEHFELTNQTSIQSNNLLDNVNSPENIFNSPEFVSLPEESLVSIIKRDDLQMKESEVWKCVLKWGLEQNPTLNPDPDTWSDNDFNVMKNTLQNCLPLIRFFSLSSKEFFRDVDPYKKLLSHQLYKDLLNSYIDSESEPNDDNISLPKSIKIDGIIDSKIVNLNIISMISRWVDKVDVNNNFSYLREMYFPYKFKLLLRGSQDGFTPIKFHELCDDKPNTIIFIKVKGSEEILGGYNPSIWKYYGDWTQSLDSFIFSFKDNIKNSTLSYVKNTDKALYFSDLCGPSFGSSDLKLSVTIRYGVKSSNPYDLNICKQEYYEKKIRDDNKFYIEDYEVFQLIRR
ncbi:uncharacterized protein OCT59_029383 [Rhizophagus irregularis]|uniref:Kelch-like protein 17 n=2 Tax=Rhizophagus irregularis TaxID=588596 RepID=A0A015I7H8_RHIIW|nr:hypothetical protein RirG_247580 [Rhizophagus irregularis DAOM 197198w]UZO09146.1 hypothetical protein OCT59_029383 [Rhizophagus irregularis]